MNKRLSPTFCTMNLEVYRLTKMAVIPVLFTLPVRTGSRSDDISLAVTSDSPKLFIATISGNCPA